MFEESLPHQSIFIRKKLFDEIGYYDENVNVISDWKFFIIAFFSHKATYKHINSVLSTFYLGGISSFGDYSNDRRLVLQENFEGFVNDYDELIKNRNELKQLKSYHKTNRVKMLKEIEKTALGRNFLSIFFRIYIITFSKNKLKQIIK